MIAPVPVHCFSITFIMFCHPVGVVKCIRGDIVLLAHLRRRAYSKSILLRLCMRAPVVHPSVGRRRPPFSRSSPKPLSQSKPNLTWSLLGKGERNFELMGKVT